MMYDISPRLSAEKKKKLLRISKKISLYFIIGLFLPIITYLLFAFHIIDSKPQYDPDLQAPVALVTTNSGTGSAFLISDKRLLTARHVVENVNEGETVSLFFEKSNPAISTEAKVVWKAPQANSETEKLLNDIAVLELIKPTALPEGFPTLSLGSSSGVTERDKVILIGYPGGIMSTTSGTISNAKVNDLDLFLLDTGAWPGNSGGPLIDESTNEVIGILIAGFTGEFQGMNLAIKSDRIPSPINKY